MIKVVEHTLADDLCDGRYEVLDIVRNKYSTCADLITQCKSWKTALERFFHELDKKSMFVGWKDSIVESCENGKFADVCQDSSFMTGWQWHYCVEEVDDGVFYIELTALNELV